MSWKPGQGNTSLQLSLEFAFETQNEEMSKPRPLLIIRDRDPWVVLGVIKQNSIWKQAWFIFDIE